jgi:hypothetical protein
MVKKVMVPKEESWENKRIDKLVKLTEETLGEGFVINRGGLHFRVTYMDSPAGASAPSLDVYFKDNKIDVYTPSIFDWGLELADAFEKSGEKEFTVRGVYC